MEIPDRFELRPDVGSPGDAVALIQQRVRLGEAFLSETLPDATPSQEQSALADFRRRVSRWQAENATIVESLLKPSDSAAGGAAAGVGPSQSMAQEFESLKDEVSRDVSQLSSLVWEIQIRYKVSAASADAASALGEFVKSAPASESPAPGPTYPDPGSEAPEYASAVKGSAGTISDATAAFLDATSTAPDEDPITPTQGLTAESPSIAPDPSPTEDQATQPAALPRYDADAVAQEDFIGIDHFVDAFSYLICARNVRPPLAIGLFGNWGSGKSFLMQAVRRRVDGITQAARTSSRPQSEIGVYRDVVQIEFNAWHYVEGNLWASLVEHIFSNLRKSPEDAELELARRQKAVTEQLASTGGRQRDLTKKIETLQEETNAKEADLKELKEKQRSQLQEVERLRVGDVAAAVTLTKDDIAAINDALPGSPLATTGQSAVDAAKNLADAREVVVRAGPVAGALRRLSWTRTAALTVALIALLVGISIALNALDASVVTRVVTSVGAFLGAAAGVIGTGTRWADSALKKIEDAEARVRKRVDDAAAEQAVAVADLQHEIDQHERELTETIQARDEAVEKKQALELELATLTPAKLLTSFLEERSSSRDYRRHLGVTALIRRDFEELSRLVEQNNEAVSADRDPIVKDGASEFNRIVLYVDDLDRCPPRRVVEVLQAVHLLLSFPIFVVVVAVDARWLAQSLEAEYPGLLGEDEASDAAPGATPSDYLEKIFQIPFTVAPLDIDARTRFIDCLLESDPAGSDGSPANGQPGQTPVLALLPPDVTAPGSGAESGSPDHPVGSSTPGSGSLPDPATVAALAPSAAASEAAVELNPASLTFTAAEIAYLKRLLPLLDTSPRILKRYVNIYRLIKSVRNLGGTDHGPEPHPYQFAMLLLALQTGLPALGPRLFDRLLDGGRGESPSARNGLIDLLDGLDPDPHLDDELARLRTWLDGEPATKTWPVSKLTSAAHYVHLYTFT